MPIKQDQQKSSPGERLRKLRAGAPQAVFALQWGVSLKSYGMYERDERAPDLEQLIRLKDLTGVDLNWLATGIESDSGPIVMAVLQAVIQAVDEEAGQIDPTSKSKLISRLYSDRIKEHKLGIEAHSLRDSNPPQGTGEDLGHRTRGARHPARGKTGK